MRRQKRTLDILKIDGCDRRNQSEVSPWTFQLRSIRALYLIVVEFFGVRV